MKIIRLRLARSLLFILIVTLFIIIYINRKNEQDLPECNLSPETLKKVENLLDTIKQPLAALKLTYFLCYDSLWGALKVNGPLPWQNTLELCALNKEIAAIDEGFLIRTFKHYNLNIAYNSAGGFYRVFKFEELIPTATITLFEEDVVTHQMRRVGFVHRLIPPNACDELNCFPPDLIEAPIPKIKFGSHTVPAPRDGIEILKYLFPNTWWKEAAPPNCRSAKT